MPDDRDYMHGDNPPADFTRRRVAGILRRERPRYENGDETSWNGLLALGKIHSSSKEIFGCIQIGKLKVYTYNLFGRIKTWRVIPMDKQRFPKSAIKKPANSNFRSRFVRFLPPDHTPRL